jgi:hypothetical protein
MSDYPGNGGWQYMHGVTCLFGWCNRTNRSQLIGDETLGGYVRYSGLLIGFMNGLLSDNSPIGPNKAEDQGCLERWQGVACLDIEKSPEKILKNVHPPV